jgi:hypothetical protein
MICLYRNPPLSIIDRYYESSSKDMHDKEVNHFLYPTKTTIYKSKNHYILYILTLYINKKKHIIVFRSIMA